MRVIDLRKQFVVYVIYSGEGKWYVSDKEIWFLDYKKRVEVFRKAGYEIKDEYIDEKRRDLMCLGEDNALLFFFGGQIILILRTKGTVGNIY